MIEQAPHRIQRESSQRKFWRLATDGLVVIEVALNWLATQLAAKVMHYPAALMGGIIGRVYQPLAWWWWRYHWPEGAVHIGQHVILMQPLWRICEGLIIYPVLVLGVIAGLIALLLTQPQQEDLHGSAQWADANEIKRIKLG